MKIYKKLFTFMICLILVVTSLVPVRANDEFVPEDSLAYEYYLEELLSMPITTTAIDLNDEMYTQNELNWSTLQMLLFYDVLRQSKSNRQFMDVYTNYENDIYKTRVFKDDSTNSIVLIEVDYLNENILILLNGCEYCLYFDGLDIVLKDSQGNMLTVSKMVNFNDNQGISTMALKDEPFSSNDDAQYTADIGPFDSQNTSVFTFIDYVSVAAGIVAATHPLLGYVEFIATSASLVMGTSQYFTSYIKYWQSMKKTNLSYVRQKERWFSNSSCADQYHIDNYTRYFDSEKPYS